jgi:acetyl esterase
MKKNRSLLLASFMVATAIFQQATAQNQPAAPTPGAAPAAAPGGRGGFTPPPPIDFNAADYPVTLDAPTHGTVTINPEIPADGKVARGTVLTVKATPEAGYTIDAGYYVNSGARDRTAIEFPDAEFTVKVDQPKKIGVSFIESAALKDITVTNNVVYAQPGVKPLKYDVFSPKGAKNLPIVVIIHGGGWTANCEDVMRGLARELTKGGQYVVFSIDYRWLNTGDGDKTPNTMNMLIEDVYGAIAHIQEHAKEYGGDATRIAVTGDSAGGHLSAAAATMLDRIGEGGFGVKEGVYEYKPTYTPKGKSVEQVRKEITKAMKVAAPSYGVFGVDMLGRFVEGQPEAAKNAVAPISNIQNVKIHNVPQYLTRGTNDGLIKNESVQAYTDALTAAGQKVVYDQVEGAGHAFFDWKYDQRTKDTFAKYGVPYAAKMKSFFDEVFYPKKQKS